VTKNIINITLLLTDGWVSIIARLRSDAAWHKCTYLLFTWS